MTNKLTIVFAAAMLATSLDAASADLPADCAGITDIKSKSRQFFEGSALMMSLMALQNQGEGDFRPKASKPSSECTFEKFDIAGVPVSAVYSPYEPGEHSLNYRFVARGSDEVREILVVGDGLAAITAKKEQLLFVIEDRKKTISYYAMFRDLPTYVALKPLITGILDGSAKPLASVKWPAGAKEPVIGAYDAKRLK